MGASGHDAPLVSAVIPTRNRPAGLADALRSVLAQTYPAIEVCVVDDASDPPVELPPDVAIDDRVRLVREDGQAGPAAARNRGVAETTGPYLAFLDDDDVWLPEKTTRQVRVLRASPPSVAGVQCGFEFFDDAGVIFTFLPDVDRDLRRVLLERPAIAPTSLMLRREAFDEAGGFDPSLRRMEDWDLWLRLADRYDIAVIAEVLARRRAHPGRRLAPLELPYRQAVIGRLWPRLASLPASERRRIEQLHRLDIARHQARAHQRRRAVMTLARAWRQEPRSRDVYRAAFVTLLVETPLWRAGRHVKARFGRSAVREPQHLSW